MFVGKIDYFIFGNTDTNIQSGLQNLEYMFVKAADTLPFPILRKNPLLFSCNSVVIVDHS